MNDLPIEVETTLKRWGEDLACARRRRQLRQADVAARAGLARQTVARIEAGHPGTPVSAWLRVMWALRLPPERFADPERDAEGRTLEAARRPRHVRAPRGLDDDF